MYINGVTYYSLIIGGVMQVIGSFLLGLVWAGHPVRFDMLTHHDMQFIAFYDAERKITVGM
jgi:hypothetical protein